MAVKITSITEYLVEIRTRLVDAAAVATGAVACAEAGSEESAIQIAMELDEITHEIMTLHGAMRLLNRRAARAEVAAAGD